MREKGEGSGEQELVAFLKSKRWFGDKGRNVRGATLRDVIAVEWPNSTKKFAVARAEIATDAGKSDYQLFLPRAESGEPRAEIDALDDPEFRRGLADAWQRGATFVHGRTRWVIESESEAALVVPPNAPITLSQAEQTNSSLIMNREAILKLYRKLEPGVHPDVEVTRFLTVDRRFVHVPVLMGTIRFEDEGGVTIAGMLQEYVNGATDGWAFALECLRASFKGTSNDASKLPFAEEAEQLGNVTRALHEHLASGDAGSDFDLQPAVATDVRRWERGAVQTVEEAFAGLGRALKDNELPRESRGDARVIQDSRHRIVARIKELAAGVGADAGANTRTHGDLHLGQTLRSASAQFLIIDFEGEPTRPLRDRRVRNSPLRDVAGMLRSFAYAAAVGSRPSALGVKEAERREPSAESVADWERGAREAFLDGYFSETQGLPGLLPRSRANAERLITLFELEKSFYELAYELDHRPDWVWVPLRGITQLLA